MRHYCENCKQYFTVNGSEVHPHLAHSFYPA